MIRRPPHPSTPDAEARGASVGVPGVVWLLVLTHLGLLAAYAVLVPTWRAPDEPRNADMVFAVREGGEWPTDGDRRVSGRITASEELARFEYAKRRTEPPLEARHATPRGERPTFAEIAPDRGTGPINHQYQHPPLYSALVARWLAAASALVPGATGWSYDQTVLAMRFVSVLLIAPLPLLCYLTASRLRLRRPVALAAAAFPLAVPQLTHIGSVVNPDSLLTAAGGVATVLLAQVATGDLRTRTGVGVGLVSGVALLTKGLALFLPLMVGLAYALAARRLGLRRAALPAAASALTALVAGGWWWVANVLRYGTVQPTGPDLRAAPEGFAPDLAGWLATAVTLLPQRWWGSFGWYQVSLPDAVVWAATTAVVAAAVAALVAGPGRALPAPPPPPRDPEGRVPVGRGHLGLLLVPLVGLLAIVGYGAWGYHVASGLTPGLQGRYLFAGVTGLSVLVAVGGTALLRGRDRRLPLGVLLGAFALQALSVVLILFRFYGSPGRRSVGDAVAGLLAWAPVGPGALGAVLLVVGAAGAACLVLLARGAPDPSDARDERGSLARRSRG